MQKGRSKFILGIIIFFLVSTIVSAVTFQTLTRDNFNQGTFSNTIFTNFLELTYTDLNLNNTHVNYGTYLSQIFNAGGLASWKNISWIEGLPYKEEINNENGNVLLFHLNKDPEFNENDNFVFDFSNNGNNGTIVNGPISLINSKFKNGFSFNGNQEINVVDSSSLDLTSGVTLEAWIKNVQATSKSDGTVGSYQKISDTEGGFTGVIYDRDRFGTSVANIGDLNGDGVTDIAVGASTGDEGSRRGAVWILFLNQNGTVGSFQKISNTKGGFTGNLSKVGNFGQSVANIGDLNGDGVTDIAVGDSTNNDGGLGRGVVWILFLNQSGFVKTYQKISDTNGTFTGNLSNGDQFGQSVANIGDLNGDGVTDIAVGAYLDNDGGADRGAVWILFLNQSGFVKTYQKISDTNGTFTGTLNNGGYFGQSIANIGDLNGNGVTDITVSSLTSGSVWILFLNQDGTVSSHKEISYKDGPFTESPTFTDNFGTSVANIGDLNGDGVTDIAVGADTDDDGYINSGAVWVLFLNQNGTVGSFQKISATEGSFLIESNVGMHFGQSITNLGDLNGDGVTDIAVGAVGDGGGGIERGAVYNIFLNPINGKIIEKQNAYTLQVTPSSVISTINNNKLTTSTLFEGWTHLATTYDRSNQNIYINGDLAETIQFTQTITTNNNNLKIGNSLKADLDEVAVYNRALTQTEILNHYKRGILNLNISVKSCNDALCAGESFTQTITNASASLTVPNNQYFQYQVEMSTENPNYTPELSSVTIVDDILDCPTCSPNQESNGESPSGKSSENARVEYRKTEFVEEAPQITDNQVTNNNEPIQERQQNTIVSENNNKITGAVTTETTKDLSKLGTYGVILLGLYGILTIFRPGTARYIRRAPLNGYRKTRRIISSKLKK